jgi:hypothetical protein
MSSLLKEEGGAIEGRGRLPSLERGHWLNAEAKRSHIGPIYSKQAPDWLATPWRKCCGSTYIRTHSIGPSSICIVEIGLTTNNLKPVIVTDFCHCWKKVCPNNQPYIFSNPAVVIVFEVSWYRHAGRQARYRLRMASVPIRDLLSIRDEERTCNCISF